MKKCDVCGSTMTSRTTTPEAPYAYTIGGLPRVGLAGIVVHQCAKCDVISPVIPKPGELHRVLTKLFLCKPGLLAGDELRFLRKQAGLSALKFAGLLGVDPSHLSRIENGKTDTLGETSDRLARAIASATMNSELVKDILLRVAESGPIRRPLMRMHKNRWKAEDAAA